LRRFAKLRPRLERRMANRARSGVGGLAVALTLLASTASAHPLGNFSVSHYSALRVDARTIELRYILDLAEIPTFQEIQEAGITPDPTHPGVSAYAARKAECLKEGIRAEIDGRRLVWQTRKSDVIFPPGAGGLPTLKIAVDYRATLPETGASATLSYRDTNDADRAGWKEIVAASGAGAVIVESSVPAADRSRQLADYPTDLLDSPPQVVTASVTFARERPAIAALPAASGNVTTPDAAVRATPTIAANRQSTPRDRFTELITTTPASPALLSLALAIAAGLGAFHALEPGHGKTMVAAYLVGARGTVWHALALGLIVTASHTAGVYLLGAVTLYASRYIVPEQIYPWLGLVSGVTIAGLGAALFLRRYAGHHAHDHGHGHSHSHDHAHHDHDHDHASGHLRSEVSLKQLFTLGVTGGIVPCPAALVVLLSALSLGRVGFGLVLIVAFSLGLAAVLIATGLLVVYARRLVSRLQGEGAMITRWLPLTSSAVIMVVGLAIAVQALQRARLL
jgi:ABC-type nickel/cobalt efflux system permease component RcnA